MTELPPYNQTIQVLRSRIRIRDISYISVIAIIIGLYSFERYENYQVSKQPKDAYMVPGVIPNIISVRANALSDDYIFTFLEYYFQTTTNWTYLNVQNRYKSLEKYFSPKLAVKLEMELENKLPFWRTNKISHVTDVDIIRTVKRTTKNKRRT